MKYRSLPERLYGALGRRYRGNPEVAIPKPWQFLKVETVIKRSPGWSLDRVPALDSPQRVVSFVREVLGDIEKSDRERVFSLFLDNGRRCLGIHEVTIGSTSASMMPPKELFRAAVIANATAVILVHNHPSGSVNFSADDRAVFKRLLQVGELLDIQILDFIALGHGGNYASATEQGIRS